MRIEGIRLSNEALQMFMGLVALSVVSRDRAEGLPAGQDFRHRIRHWWERLEADPNAMTDLERTDVEKLLRMLEKRVVVSERRWDDLQSWPDLRS